MQVRPTTGNVPAEAPAKTAETPAAPAPETGDKTEAPAKDLRENVRPLPNQVRRTDGQSQQREAVRSRTATAIVTTVRAAIRASRDNRQGGYQGSRDGNRQGGYQGSRDGNRQGGYQGNR